MKTIYYNSNTKIEQELKRPESDNETIVSTVKNILNNVKVNGDEALKFYAKQFDNVALSSLKVTADEIAKADAEVQPELKKAIAVAYANIKNFHTAQRNEEEKVDTMPGVTCWRKAVAIEKVGLYIPGGTAPLFSTLLMLGVPAQIAGCKELVICTPCNSKGEVAPAILYTAQLLGITAVYKAGGAQAIGAMAFGTASIPKVSKIFGPGNQFVTTAKQLIAAEGTAIDMPAGPSEVAVIADDSCVPAFVAADLLSQAEHGIDSQVVLIATNEDLAMQVQEQIALQLEALPRKEIAQQALNNSKSVIVSDLSEAMEVSNQYAPEHLILATEQAESLLDKVQNAGSVFVGNYTPEAAGDYASGTNHTLPTNGFANAYSGVSLDSFMKKITFQKISKEGLKNIGETIEIMAAAEQLEAHKNAVSIRLKTI